MKNRMCWFVLSAAVVTLLAGCASVVLDTHPTGAQVYDKSGETLLGTTPFDTRIIHNPKKYVVRKDRYYDEPVLVEFNAAPQKLVLLRPEPVLLKSDPQAAVYRAGEENPIGRTPMRVAVDGGRAYVLKADGYYDRDVTVRITSPDPHEVTLDRRPIVTVSSSPDGVDVYEEGRRIGTAPFTEEILRERTFELRKAGHFSETITLTGAPPYEVAVVLRPYPEIAVEASPASATILRDGETIGTGTARLSVGKEIGLTVRADRYYEQTVTLTPESPARVQVSLQPMPYVTVSSQPPGAQVLAAGRVLGTAPVELLVEQPVTVELRREGYITRTQQLSGRDARVTVTLEKIPEPEPEVPEFVEPEKPEEEEVLSWWQRLLRFLGL